MSRRIYDPDGGISWEEEQERDAAIRAQAEEQQFYGEQYAAMERDHLGDDGMDAPFMGDDLDQRPYDERLSSRFEEPTDALTMPGTDITATDALARARADGLAMKRTLGIPSFEEMADQARQICAELFPTSPQLQERLRDHARTRLNESRVERGYDRGYERRAS